MADDHGNSEGPVSGDSERAAREEMIAGLRRRFAEAGFAPDGTGGTEG
jgi:hypothetical protein